VAEIVAEMILKSAKDLQELKMVSNNLENDDSNND